MADFSQLEPGGLRDELETLPSGAKRSVEVDAGDVQLVGDEASPDPERYYGTDDQGALGFHELPEGGGAVDDSGNVLGGTANFARAVAVGGQSSASSSDTTSVGYGASADNQYEGVLGTADTGVQTEGSHDWIVPGDFTVNGSKNFDIPHPGDPDTRIQHGAYEGPVRGGLIYEGTVEAVDGEVREPLPEYVPAIGRGFRCHATPETLALVAARYDDGANEVVIEADRDVTVHWQVTAERNDPAVQGIRAGARPVGVRRRGEAATLKDTRTTATGAVVVRMHKGPDDGADRWHDGEADPTPITEDAYTGQARVTLTDIVDDEGEPVRVRLDDAPYDIDAIEAEARQQLADRDPGNADTILNPPAWEGPRPWVQPSGSHDAYDQGEQVLDGGQVWESTTPGNVWAPGISGWHPVSEGDEPAAWVQPTGAHDAYQQGDQVTHDDTVWESDIDHNVWQPPEQWTEVTP